MPMNQKNDQHIGSILINGRSTAGTHTSIVLPQYDLAFDVAPGIDPLYSVSNFFISHGHMDHAGALPYIISFRNLNKNQNTHIFVPEALYNPLFKIIQLWEEIEEHHYHFKLTPLTPNEVIPLKGSYWVKSFKTDHRIPSLGYLLFETRKKLKKEFFGLPGQELAELKRKGIQIESTVSLPLIGYSGDTKIEALIENEEFCRCQTVFIECTYLDERKTTENARKWGHIHLTELLPHLDQFKSEKIVLFHISGRYSKQQINEILDKRIPPQIRPRIIPFPNR